MTTTSHPTALDLLASVLMAVNDSDLSLLDRAAVLDQLREELVTSTRLRVLDARDQGASWSDVGARFDITRQAAQQRFS